ncbi:UspA domain protein (plasmid) [Natrialba magadii ATCC 43099]|uniref:UspA domain protein n=1 Tax=Natrialba magadii (strain ATCC 43099 / DSM 3394 / CCM 3739 / CIP 104546 / IAM 13178 / JCM 8861 / NBRC 102185 / NCIMB 2190 / MS3) TaxID=547559 RepID=D3T190_NATMM|nr:universal stress protein [Natrialba magadii]ADD07349.1 UspA domain protein [Natrialba magadii ATCC 43099]ELY32605.1 UspA domain-containing protein [Natrialba magadii ATCC 43099]
MHCLVAIDGSDASKNALVHAIDVADAMGGSITAVHSVDPSVFEEGGTEPISGLGDADNRLVIERLDDAEARGLDVLENAERVADEHGADVEMELLYGNPVEAITDYAEEFDALFVGHRGRSERTDLLIGSVAKSIVERATVPVTVVR